MSKTFFIFIIAVMVTIIAFRELGGARLFGINTKTQEKLPYRVIPYFFNKSEQAFFLELKKQLPDEYHIFSKVRIIDFIEPTDRTTARWKNKIISKHVDFLVCDQQLKPIVAIEVDGKSHRSARRRERDEFLNKVFKDVDLRLERISVGADFSEMIQNISPRG